jgi:hypothetical protein
MNFFGRLLKPNSDTSSRRFIALLQLPLLYLGCIILIYSKNPTLMVVGVTIPFLIVMLGYFSLNWKDAQNIISTLTKTKIETSKSEETINDTESTQ